MRTATGIDRLRQPVEPVFLENTLLRVFGVMFCHDPKRARTRTGKVEINRGVSDKKISVRFDPEYAQPGPFAHKVVLAVMRKQSGYGRPAQKSISFSQRELIRMTGRTSMGGKHSEELMLALRQIRYSHVIAHFKKEDRLVEHDFSIFNEILIERRAAPTDPIVACTVVLADPIIQSLNDKHFTCLNHSVMQELSTISTALYMRLFHHFSTHYDGKHADRVVFKKRYDDICVEWLGGITVLKHRSKIMGEQLGQHLDQLVAVGFLRSYTLAPAETRDGFVLSFRPGFQFVQDYNLFYTRRGRGSISISFDDEQQSIGDPHRVAYLFIERQTGEKPQATAFVSSKDVLTAKELLQKIPAADMGAFFDFALSEAKKTRFDLQTLGGAKQYLNGYLLQQSKRHIQKAASASIANERAQTQQRIDYDEFRRAAGKQLFDRLSLAQKKTIEQRAEQKLRFGPRPAAYMMDTLLRVEKLRLTIELHGSRIPTFEQWSKKRAA